MPTGAILILLCIVLMAVLCIVLTLMSMIYDYKLKAAKAAAYELQIDGPEMANTAANAAILANEFGWRDSRAPGYVPV